MYLIGNRFGDLVHESSKFHISSAESVNVMRRESYLYLVINIEPLGMVVHFIGHKSRTSHKTESLK